MDWITFPLPVFHHCLHTLWQRPSAPLRHPVGVSRWGGHLELLATAAGSAVGHSLLLGWTDTFARPQVLPPDCLGVLLLGRNRQRGRALGAVRRPTQEITPAHALRLVGPGMLTINLQQARWPGRSSPAAEASSSRPIRALVTHNWGAGARGVATVDRLALCPGGPGTDRE